MHTIIPFPSPNNMFTKCLCNLCKHIFLVINFWAIKSHKTCLNLVRDIPIYGFEICPQGLVLNGALFFSIVVKAYAFHDVVWIAHMSCTSDRGAGLGRVSGRVVGWHDAASCRQPHLAVLKSLLSKCLLNKPPELRWPYIALETTHHAPEPAHLTRWIQFLKHVKCVKPERLTWPIIKL